jgi:hypothetical protein
MIWKKWETVQRFATTTQALSVKRTGFSRQPSHIKVTSGCQGDRLFEEKILLKFFWGSSQERRISSLDSRMANKVKFVCHWILESWPLLPRAHFALSVFSVTEFEKRIGAATLNWILFYFLPPCCLALLVVDCVSSDELLASFMSSLSWLYKKVWCFWFRSPVIAALPLSPGLNI